MKEKIEIYQKGNVTSLYITNMSASTRDKIAKLLLADVKTIELELPEGQLDRKPDPEREKNTMTLVASSEQPNIKEVDRTNMNGPEDVLTKEEAELEKRLLIAAEMDAPIEERIKNLRDLEEEFLRGLAKGDQSTLPKIYHWAQNELRILDVCEGCADRRVGDLLLAGINTVYSKGLQSLILQKGTGNVKPGTPEFVKAAESAVNLTSYEDLNSLFKSKTTMFVNNCESREIV